MDIFQLWKVADVCNMLKNTSMLIAVLYRLTAIRAFYMTQHSFSDWSKMYTGPGTRVAQQIGSGHGASLDLA